MAKWDIKDGFWRLDVEEGTEWNFVYVLPQSPGKPIYLVVPTSLQMGWVESPPFFCTASETARDVAQDYCETKIDTLPPHKFTNYVTGNQAYDELPERNDSGNNFRYCSRFMSMILSVWSSPRLANKFATSVRASWQEYTVSFQPMTSTQTIPFRRRSLSNEMANMQRKGHSGFRM